VNNPGLKAGVTDAEEAPSPCPNLWFKTVKHAKYARISAGFPHCFANFPLVPKELFCDNPRLNQLWNLKTSSICEHSRLDGSTYGNRFHPSSGKAMTSGSGC
jgi:hypothetical protein